MKDNKEKGVLRSDRESKLSRKKKIMGGVLGKREKKNYKQQHLDGGVKREIEEALGEEKAQLAPARGQGKKENYGGYGGKKFVNKAQETKTEKADLLVTRVRWNCKAGAKEKGKRNGRGRCKNRDLRKTRTEEGSRTCP